MKIKSLIQVIIIIGLGLGSVVYGDVMCSALRTSQAYQKGKITEERLQELYSLWKDGLNKILKTSYDTEDPISTYEDFKIIFGLGKKRIQVNCPMYDKTECKMELEQIARAIGKKTHVLKRNLNTEDKIIELILEDTEDLVTGFLWAYLHYYQCDDNLDKIINEFSLELQKSINMEDPSNLNKKEL